MIMKEMQIHPIMHIFLGSSGKKIADFYYTSLEILLGTVPKSVQGVVIETSHGEKRLRLPSTGYPYDLITLDLVHPEYYRQKRDPSALHYDEAFADQFTAASVEDAIKCGSTAGGAGNIPPVTAIMLESSWGASKIAESLHSAYALTRDARIQAKDQQTLQKLGWDVSFHRRQHLICVGAGVTGATSQILLPLVYYIRSFGFGEQSFYRGILTIPDQRLSRATPVNDTRLANVHSFLAEIEHFSSDSTEFTHSYPDDVTVADPSPPFDLLCLLSPSGRDRKLNTPNGAPNLDALAAKAATDLLLTTLGTHAFVMENYVNLSRFPQFRSTKKS